MLVRNPLTAYGIGPESVQTGSLPLICGRAYRTYTIFEGTSEIQRLILLRAISGVHVR